MEGETVTTISTDVWTEIDSCSIPLWADYYGEKKVEFITKKTRYIQMIVDSEGVILAVSDKSLKDKRWLIEECDEVYDCTYETDECDGESAIRTVCLNKSKKSKFHTLFCNLDQLITDEQKKKDDE